MCVTTDDVIFNVYSSRSVSSQSPQSPCRYSILVLQVGMKIALKITTGDLINYVKIRHVCQEL